VPPQLHETPPPDNGLRQMLTWTFVALIGALLVSAVGVYLVTRWFGGP
jgi:hypothetical protein